MAALIKKYLFQALAILKKFGVTVAPFLKWLVLLLIPIAVFFYLRWKKKKNLAGHEEKAKLPKNSLKKIYQKFLSGLPAHVRRSILNFEPYVVLGEAGSGKSEIINNYSDWEAQSLAFYPSYSTDPNLQLYLASGSLIQEIPSTLLHDVSSSAADALKRLWRQNFVN